MSGHHQISILIKSFLVGYRGSHYRDKTVARNSYTVEAKGPSSLAKTIHFHHLPGSQRRIFSPCREWPPALRDHIIQWSLFTGSMGLLPDTVNCGCACAGNARNVFPATEGKRSRHASQHARGARAEMHAGSLTSGFFWSRWWEKTFPAFPTHAQPAMLLIW